MFMKLFQSSCVFVVFQRSIYLSHRSNKSLIEAIRKPADYFTNPTVYWLLAGMALKDQRRVHALRQHQQGLVNDLPKVCLMTDAELINVTKKSAAVTAQRLQMPPILHERPFAGQILQQDPRLDRCLLPQQRLMVIDIGLEAAVNNKQGRLCVVRESDGTLREASWEERDRLEQAYFPLPGRRSRVPVMFTEMALLDQLLRNEQYEYVLERACLQFEPDDTLFLAVTQRVYEAIAEKANSDTAASTTDDSPLYKLQCTRHFGPLCLHLVMWGKMNSLFHMLLCGEQLSILLRLLHLIMIVRPVNTAAAKCLLNLTSPLPEVPGLKDLLNLQVENDSAAMEAVTVLGKECVLSKTSEIATLNATIALSKDSAACVELHLDSAVIEKLAQNILSHLLEKDNLATM